MKTSLLYLSIIIFSIFLGSQITEGVLLVPYWQSLPAADFYTYYQQWGPLISKFYSILTIIALIIPLAVAIYCRRNKSNGFRYALISSIFAIIFVATFYIYFKGTNALFYEGAFSDIELKNELMTWRNWHWARVFVECLSLLFLVLSINKIQNRMN